MKTTYSLEELPKVAELVLKNIKTKFIIFNGDMGVGKTTLIKEITKQLGVDDIANSPTFSLVNEYNSNKGEQLFHFDFYRIESEEEVYDIGIEDYFYHDAWCFIEWPEKVKNLLPLEIDTIFITRIDQNKRQLQIN